MQSEANRETSGGDPAGVGRTPILVDTHAHLSDPRLRDHLGAVLDRAVEAGVGHVISAATTAADSGATLELARSDPRVSAALGIHPNEASGASPDDWRRIVDLAGEPGVVAIGETGLDRHWDRTPFPVQQEVFDRHLALARERELPIIIHCRDCYGDVIDQLARQGSPVRGVLHSFAGTWDDARALLDLGLHISFAGMITFANKALDALRDVASRVPEDRLLVETDSPYLSPHPYRGKTNEPARAAVTAACLASLRGLPLDVLAARTTANVARLFGVHPGPGVA
jgi:TatD DNase family protein